MENFAPDIITQMDIPKRYPFPRPIKDFGRYQVHFTPAFGKIFPTSVTTLASPPRLHQFDTDYICHCQEEMSGIRIAAVCIHEQVACLHQKYFLCPHCQITKLPIHKQFAMVRKVVADGVEFFYLLCMHCPLSSPPAASRESWQSDWIGHGFEYDEALGIYRMLSSSKKIQG